MNSLALHSSKKSPLLEFELKSNSSYLRPTPVVSPSRFLLTIITTNYVDFLSEMFINLAHNSSDAEGFGSQKIGYNRLDALM